LAFIRKTFKLSKVSLWTQRLHYLDVNSAYLYSTFAENLDQQKMFLFRDEHRSKASKYQMSNTGK
jgi:hypothetical protein